MCSRTKQLKIIASLYSPLKGSRAIYHIEGNFRSRIRGVKSSCQVLGKDTISSFWLYYLWEFGDFFVILLLCNPNKIL